MIRIHVLLLASLLSIWGLTSCENSDTDKVNAARKSKVDDNTAKMQSIKQLGV